MDYIVIILLLCVGGFVIGFFFFLNRRLMESEREKVGLVQMLDRLESKVGSELFRVSTSLEQRFGTLQNTFDKRLIDNTQRLDTRLDNAAKSFAQVHSLMERVLESNRHIHDIGKDISSLQEILRAPKLRGGLGELFLEDLLSQVFPRQNYDLQYSFRSGEKVDAIIKLRGGMVSVDSKFPLENFHKMAKSEQDTERKQLRKLFVGDVKKHIDAIAQKYILPDEGTLDFALMYIPAENVYYETIIKEGDDRGILQYAFDHKVIPVSPNTLYVYINTILLGLKGMQIEEHAKFIMSGLKRIMQEYTKFRQDFNVLGRHLNDSKNKFDVADKRLEKFESQLEGVSSGDSENGILESGKENG